MDPSPEPDDLLSQHGAFLRRLAGDLTRCEADADDLVQATWTEALVRPPQSWGSPRGWLATVARRLAGKGRRGDSRRSQRELLAARHERLEADLDLSLVLGELSEALRELPPALRRILVARHFQGLELRAIAHDEGVSLSTVKARLARAHGELRQRLDAGGSRERWMGALLPLVPVPTAPLVPPVESGSLPTLAAGVLTVTATTKAIAATVVLVGALAAGYGLRSDQPRALQPLAAPEGQVAHAAPVEAEPALDTTRSVAAAAEELEPEADADGQHAPESRMEVLVTDLFGVPASGVKVYAAPEGLPLNSFGSTDGAGKVVIRWFSDSSTELIVGVRSDQRWLGGLRRFRIGAGGRKRLELALHPDLTPQKAFSFAGLAHGYSLVESSLVLSADSIVFEHLSGTVQEVKLAPKRPSPVRPNPWDLALDGPVRFSAYGQPEPQTVESYGRIINLMGPDVLGVSDDDPGQDGRVEGTLTDSHGDALSSVEVLLMPQDFGQGEIPIGGTKRSDEHGRFEFELPPGRYQLRVPSKGEPCRKETIVVTAGGTTQWQGNLDLGLRLRGQVGLPAEEGEAEQKTILASASSPTAEGLWIGVTKADDEGRFWIPRCPAQTLDVDISVGKQGPPLSFTEGVAIMPTPWLVHIDPAALAKVSYLPMDGEEGQAQATELRVWDAGGRRGWSGSVGGRLGEAASIGLPVGLWRLEIRGGLLDSADPLSVQVDGTEAIDLGPVSMPLLAWIDLPHEGITGSWLIERLPERACVFTGSLDLEAGSPLHSVPLAPGHYAVRLRGQSGAEDWQQEIELRATQRETVKLPQGLERSGN